MAVLLGLDSVVESSLRNSVFKLSFGLLEIGGCSVVADLSFGISPNMFDGVVVRSIGRHGNKVEVFKRSLFREFCLDHLTFMPLGVIPDDTDFLSWVFLHENS